MKFRNAILRVPFCRGKTQSSMRRSNYIPGFLGLKGMPISSSYFQKPSRLRAERACATTRFRQIFFIPVSFKEKDDMENLFWDLV